MKKISRATVSSSRAMGGFCSGRVMACVPGIKFHRPCCGMGLLRSFGYPRYICCPVFQLLGSCSKRMMLHSRVAPEWLGHLGIVCTYPKARGNGSVVLGELTHYMSQSMVSFYLGFLVVFANDGFGLGALVLVGLWCSQVMFSCSWGRWF